jgi:hypothetical protein
LIQNIRQCLFLLAESNPLLSAKNTAKYVPKNYIDREVTIDQEKTGSTLVASAGSTVRETSLPVQVVVIPFFALVFQVFSIILSTFFHSAFVSGQRAGRRHGAHSGLRGVAGGLGCPWPLIFYLPVTVRFLNYGQRIES